MIDASIAFFLVLLLVQMCLLWTHLVVGSTLGMHSTAEGQARLIAASDRLINDPKCLAQFDRSVGRVVPQTIDTAKLGQEAEYCHGNYSISGDRELGGGINSMPPPEEGAKLVVKRLVFLGEEGGEVGVLAVW